MSTPKWKKEAKMREHAAAKERREFEKKYGLTIRAKKVTTEFVPYTPPKVVVRETPNYPSLSNNVPVGFAAKPERKVYTGDLIVGIATMHKSNLVPVMRGTSQAEDIAKMRRG